MNLLLRNLRSSILLVLIVLLAIPAYSQKEKKAVSLMDVYANRDFYTMPIPDMQWMKDGKRYCFQKRAAGKKGTDLYTAEAATGKEEPLLETSSLKTPGSDEAFSYIEYTLSPDESRILFKISEQEIWRYSTTGTYVIYDLKAKVFIALPEHAEGLRNVKFSPDGSKLGYVCKDEIYAYDFASKTETQLTFDAQEHVFNGRFGWVYEEEFSIIDGWRWSPDGKRIAYWQEDERQVPEFTMTDWMPQYNKLIPIRYPKAGDPNPIMKIGVVELAAKKTTWMDIGAETDIYIPRIYWTNDPKKLCIVRLNRLQNNIDVLMADAATGKSTAIISETSSTGWIEIEDDFIVFLKQSDTFIWPSEKTGWKHLYRYDYSGKQLNAVTSGDWEVTGVPGISEDEDYVYFVSTEVSPLQRHLYRAKMNGKDKKQLTTTDGYHNISLSPTGEYYMDSWSSMQSPSKIAFYDEKGKEVRVYKEAKPEAYASYKWQNREVTTFKTADGLDLYISILKPADFDATKKYPVYMDVYGGPGYQAVTDRWPQPVHQWIAGEGFVVVQVDNRGGGARGTAFKHAVYKQLGKWEANDYIEAAKYLATLPFVDKDKIGIWGWSYGGYMSALSMLLGAEFFKAAVAIAPVTDWSLYDTIYAERYMQRPKDNPEGYKAGSCIEHADKLKGKLLIIHGGMDDNVHVQNTMQFIDRLEESGKDFDMRIYPNGNHGVVGSFESRIAMYNYFLNFFKKNLK